ncbi:MAG: hypothetical protein HY043_06220 [Verrucomicrobia bacterium]|nr:hypothetical protein [Verrucomicrobiota bacterium]
MKRDTQQAVKATLPEPEIVTRKGKPVSVIIPIKDCLPGRNPSGHG